MGVDSSGMKVLADLPQQSLFATESPHMKLLASRHMEEQDQAGPALGRQALGHVSSSPGTEEEDIYSGVWVDPALQFEVLTQQRAFLFGQVSCVQLACSNHGERHVHLIVPKLICGALVAAKHKALCLLCR